MKKIWITGACGMLGSHFLRTLENRAIPCIGTFVHNVDITNFQQVEAFASENDIGTIINCAGYTAVDKAEDESELAFRVNAIGPENLAKAANALNLDLLHFSTDYVFSGKSSVPYKETDPAEPISSYGISKWEGEKRTLKYAPDSIIMRLSWLYGYPGHNFVETMLRLMQEKETLNVVCDQEGRPTYCQDVVDTALILLKSGKKGIFHFANSGITSWFDFASEILNLAKKNNLPIKTRALFPITTDNYPTKAKRPAYSVFNTDKIENALGIKIRHWQDALKEYLSTYHPKEEKCLAS